ncbi:hypothetical protein CERZMDRAFT_87178 [Cercospora zeae-maydis SCOH1-5]|uniref:RNase III domain-containing protein n=1 Tax=Cercospora zeae-maydis SCOH1-5 TaxID=717836 RepID=A0A6A6F612_9PEZI|nr:hypothetical protein CERZMDRAFT_87178 [Cercospora zeae-maydis SCOH1-5]
MTRPSDPRRAQEILTYVFQNVDLLREALQAPGLGAIVGGRVVSDGNKRLYCSGLALSKHRSSLLAIREAVVETQFCTAPARLAQLAQQTTLDICVATSPSQRNDELPASLLADTLKAVLAAVWIDCGFDLNVWTPVAAALGYMHHQISTLDERRYRDLASSLDIDFLVTSYCFVHEIALACSSPLALAFQHDPLDLDGPTLHSNLYIMKLEGQAP